MSDLSKCGDCGRDLNGVNEVRAQVGSDEYRFCSTTHMIAKMNQVRQEEEQAAAAEAAAKAAAEAPAPETPAPPPKAKKKKATTTTRKKK